MITIPQHLADPQSMGHIYGTVDYDAKKRVYRIDAEPRVLQVAKRVLPGCNGRSVNGTLSFSATSRSMEDLNWLLMRFPMDIKNRDAYDTDLDRSRRLAVRRAEGFTLPPIKTTALFHGKLRPYQKEGVSFLVHNRRALLADGIGLGKTVMAMGAIAQANAFPVVVVAPSNIQHQWVEHANAFLNVQGLNLLNEQAIILKGTKPYAPDPYPVYVLHYGLLQHWSRTLRDMGVKVVIFDEVQDLRHPTTNKYSAASNLSIDADYAWGLSGTPIHNYGGEIHSVLNIIEHLCLEDYGSFSKEWCCGYDSKRVNEPGLLGGHLRREGLMMRRVLEDVNLQLPPIRRATTRIDHDKDKYQAGVSGIMALAKSYAGITEYHEKGQAKRKILAATRYATGVAKAPYAAAFIESLVEAGEKVLVFAWHHDVHDHIHEKLVKNHRVVKLTGRQTPTEKAEAQKAFSDGRADVIMMSLRTAAGLNGLQNHGTCVVFAELDWSPATHSQCEGRLHRDGVKVESVLCYYLVSATGYDETMREALGFKVFQFKGLMAEATESEEERKVADEDIQKHMDSVIERLSGE